jgi:hypothetical protein
VLVANDEQRGQSGDIDHVLLSPDDTRPGSSQAPRQQRH